MEYVVKHELFTSVRTLLDSILLIPLCHIHCHDAKLKLVTLNRLMLSVYFQLVKDQLIALLNYLKGDDDFSLYNKLFISN